MLIICQLFSSWHNRTHIIIIIESIVLVVATKETGLEVNADKTKYMIMSRDQNAGRSHSMKIDNSSIQRVEEFKYLGKTLTNKKFYSGRN